MMKKILLSILLMLSVAAIVAQTPMMKQNARLSTISAKHEATKIEYTPQFNGEVNPFVSNVKAPDIVVGVTRYDLQSNNSMARRIHAYADGTIGATFTFGMLDPGFVDRGTGYNYFNGTSWSSSPTGRLETVRTGWPSYQPYGPNGEIVCTHSATAANGLVFSWRATKGAGTWNSFNLLGPVENPNLLWPRMMTSGENNEIIHVIALTAPSGNGGVPYQGLDGALVYSRSSDGGATWEPRNVILPGIAAGDVADIGGDIYAWAAPKGDTIAFVVGDFLADGIVMKSTDGGDTWESMKFYEAPIPAFNNNVPLPRHGGLDGYNAIVLDDQGRVHVAAGRMMHSADGGGGPTSYFPYSNGLLYWNETMPPLDSTKVTANILNPNGMPPQYLLAQVVDNGTDSIIGVATYQASLTSMPQLVFDYEKKFLYAFWSGLTLGFATDDYNYRHIWMRYSEDYGQTWSAPQDLTGTIFQIFSECVYPSAASRVTDKVHVLYQSDNQPGNAVRFEGHGINENKIVYLPVTRILTSVQEQTANILSIQQLYPNPARESARVVVNVDRAVNAEISLINMIGQEVYSSSQALSNAGPHELRLELNKLDAGVYFVRVKAGNSAAVQKLVIQ